jgi:hypothetical protein
MSRLTALHPRANCSIVFASGDVRASAICGVKILDSIKGKPRNLLAGLNGSRIVFSISSSGADPSPAHRRVGSHEPLFCALARDGTWDGEVFCDPRLPLCRIGHIPERYDICMYVTREPSIRREKYQGNIRQYLLTMSLASAIIQSEQPRAASAGRPGKACNPTVWGPSYSSQASWP